MALAISKICSQFLKNIIDNRATNAHTQKGEAQTALFHLLILFSLVLNYRLQFIDAIFHLRRLNRLFRFFGFGHIYFPQTRQIIFCLIEQLIGFVLCLRRNKTVLKAFL